MYKFFLLVSLPLILISCTSSEIKQNENNSKTPPQHETLELVDIRIYENGGVKINGTYLSS